MSTTSFTNTLSRTRNFARKNAAKKEESEQEVCSPEQVNNSTVESYVGKSSIDAHLESPFTRKTTSLLSGQPEEEFLVNPVIEPTFQTIDSEESVAF